MITRIVRIVPNKMKLPVAVAILICFLLPNIGESKVFTNCGLGKELTERRFPRSFISNWICLIDSESGKNTSKITTKADRSQSFGLFQINSKLWCAIGHKGGKCNVRCEDMADEDLSDDVACAKKIYDASGFQGWEGWKRACYRRKLFDISRC